MIDQGLLVHTEIVIKEVEKLLLHQVDLILSEEGAVSLPVLVLGAAVVEVLGCNDECCQEDSVVRAGHALRGRGESVAESVQVHERHEERWYLDTRLTDQRPDKVLESGHGCGAVSG